MINNKNLPLDRIHGVTIDGFETHTPINNKGTVVEPAINYRLRNNESLPVNAYCVFFNNQHCKLSIILCESITAKACRLDSYILGKN